MSTNKILLTKIIKGSILEIVLNNPTKRNPLSLELILLLQNLFNSLKKNKKIKVILLKSTGPSFCSGHDLKKKRLSNSKSKLLILFKKCSK